MSTVSAPFDPSKKLAGSSFPSLLGTGYGKIVFFNLSPYELRLTFDNGDTRLAPAWWARRFDILDNPTATISWTIEATPSSANPPLSQCWIEVYAEDEPITEVYPAALVRQANIGNSIAVNQSVSSVQNDGNAPGTNVVEATPQGAATSQLKWNNDGSGVFGGGNVDVNNAGIFTSIPADAIPPAAIGVGALDSDVTIVASQISGGVPATDVTGTLPASQVGTGYPGANVSGAVASATNATFLTDGTHSFAATANGPDNAIFSEYRPSGTPLGTSLTGWDGTNTHYREVVDPNGHINADTCPASGVTGTLPASQVGTGYPGADVSGAVASATDATNLYNGGDAASANSDQSLAVPVGISSSSGNGFSIWHNATPAGTFVDAVDQAYQLMFGASGPQIRYSTNTPATGAVITWSAWWQLGIVLAQSAQPATAGIPAFGQWINTGI